MTFHIKKTYKQTGNSFDESVECKDHAQFLETMVWWNYLLHDVFVCEEVKMDMN